MSGGVGSTTSGAPVQREVAVMSTPARQDEAVAAGTQRDAPAQPPTEATRLMGGQATPTPSGIGPLPQQFGRYRVLALLGRGGMGAVYLAHDTAIDRQVALKIPHLEVADDPQALERFYREARAAGQLRHPNICPVFDV